MILPHRVTIITPQLRTPDGVYFIPGSATHVHEFIIEIDGQVRIPIQQLPGKQSFSIRAWIGDGILGNSLFFRFSPGDGGLSHLFFDENLDPAPMPEGNPHFNKFAGQEFSPTDRAIGLAPGTYYYHVVNMESQDNAYKIGFVLDLAIPNLSKPCDVFN